MTLCYNFPSFLSLEAQHGLPCNEVLWTAETQEEWFTLQDTCVQDWRSAEAVVRRLGDDPSPTPTNIGMFGCHVIISTLLQKIMLFRRSCSNNDSGFLEARRHHIRVLRRWQTMWEHEPEASLSPDHPRGPILFNCTALLRVAYIRLVADYAPVRTVFGFCESLDQIENVLSSMEPLERGPQTTRAALQACLALRIPVHLGFEVVARTSFWIWSVQHALCYFECALLLAQWLQVAEDANDLSNDEQMVLKLVGDVVRASGALWEDSRLLSVTVLRSWARLLDAGNATVWQIMPKMAQVLQNHADVLVRAPKFRLLE
jgi:hypothetical protein